jgi:alkylhydroperoxidase/carboxymuconolactone decarboxylase family protein YurZ
VTSGATGYRETLRRLALNDPRYLASILGSPDGFEDLDPRVTALVRLAALVALGGPPPAFAHAVSVALGSGASRDEIAQTLIAVAPLVGSARTVKAAPKVALGMGYDVEADIEAWPGRHE